MTADNSAAAARGGMSSQGEELRRFSSAGRTTRISRFNGEVTFTEQRSDTAVSGNISTGLPGTTQGKISSKVTVVRHFRLKGRDGGQRSFSIQADLPVAPGDVISVFFADDVPFKVYNHTTDQEASLPLRFSLSGFMSMILLVGLMSTFAFLFFGLWQVSGVIFIASALATKRSEKQYNQDLERQYRLALRALGGVA